ncbi:unnamed protein product [Dovyalis caffra]|uniref:Uncharacterized protein n=1 Tax=Dovyalis caffra TaxID=77055 RepID=A0AAV1SIY8_9ROSI|nr:unnamed protein product [Dovyalis caffra]
MVDEENTKVVVASSSATVESDEKHGRGIIQDGAINQGRDEPVICRDLVTKKTIGEGFHLHGLYYFSPDSQAFKSFQVCFLSYQ